MRVNFSKIEQLAKDQGISLNALRKKRLRVLVLIALRQENLHQQELQGC